MNSWKGAAVLLCLAASGCGYHTAGHTTQLPANLRTIAIPAFVNQSKTYRIEQRLTAAVVREFVTRTRYHIANQPDENADATLRGTVLNVTEGAATYDSKTGRAATVQITLSMKVTLTDRQGNVLYDNPTFIFRDQYQVSSQFSSFFEGDVPALERMSRQFAQTLVSNILEGF